MIIINIFNNIPFYGATSVYSNEIVMKFKIRLHFFDP